LPPEAPWPHAIVGVTGVGDGVRAGLSEAPVDADADADALAVADGELPPLGEDARPLALAVGLADEPVEALGAVELVPTGDELVLAPPHALATRSAANASEAGLPKRTGFIHVLPIGLRRALMRHAASLSTMGLLA
jgi:hypothetical protein